MPPKRSVRTVALTHSPSTGIRMDVTKARDVDAAVLQMEGEIRAAGGLYALVNNGEPAHRIAATRRDRPRGIAQPGSRAATTSSGRR